MTSILFFFYALVVGPLAWSEGQPACVAVLEDSFSALVARGMAENGPGFAVHDLKNQLSTNARESFASDVNTMFDGLSGSQMTPYYDRHYDQLSLSLLHQVSSHPKYYNQLTTKFNLNYNLGREFNGKAPVWRKLSPIVDFLKPMIEAFVRGLPEDERPFVRVSHMDFRRYKENHAQDEEPHADEAGLSLLLALNGGGTILEPAGQQIKTREWELLAISNKDRSLFKKSAVPTLHRAPDAEEGRIFIRISFYYTSVYGDAAQEFQAELERITRIEQKKRR